MAATTHWTYGNPTIVVHEFVGTWSMPEFESEILGATSEILNRPEKVVVVFNVLQYTMPARNINVFPMLRRLTQNRPANIQMVIIVVRDPFAYALLSLVQRVVPKTEIMFAVKSMDEAMVLVAKHAKAS